MDFVHLNIHSWFSKGWGVSSPRSLCEGAKRLGQSVLAMTDLNALYGMMDFLREAKEVGIRPIIGCEVADHSGVRALLLVRTRVGYENLCRLVSLRHCHSHFSLMKYLRSLRTGLIVISDHFELLKQLKKQNKEDLYVELSPGYCLHECYAFSRQSKLPPVATHRVYFVCREDYEDHMLLRAVDSCQKLSRLKQSELARPEGYLISSEEMAYYFPHVPEALENSVKISEHCTMGWDFEETVFPKFEGCNNEETLYRLAWEGCKVRYGQVNNKVLERLNYEMEIIRKKGFVDYFLVVLDIIGKGKLTCGRGSAAASIISYALGITHVDPVKNRLFFERFLNLSRKDPPDIDIDFAWDERDALLDDVFAKYRSNRVAMVANHVTLSERSCVRETAKVYGMSDGQISHLIKSIPRFLLTPSKRKELYQFIDKRGGELSFRWKEILERSLKLKGVFRYLSIHCGGIVIVPEDIRNHVPVEVPPKGLPTVQWDKDGVEAAGLVKIDLLGNRSLAVIRDALKWVSKRGGEKVDYFSLRATDDDKTLRMFYSGETMGVFYFESPATRILLKKVGRSLPFEAYKKSDHFDLNTIVTSIIRPASNSYINEWVERMRGKEWKHIHPLLESALEETLGVMVYQEQMSLAAIDMAGFSPSKGDELRKVVTKKHRHKRLKDFERDFLKGALEKGVPVEIIRQVWEMILSFDGYSFCKPHSASYTMVAYKSAWLRSHYPAEFMAAVISNGGGFYSTFAYLSEARRMGIKVLSLDINESEYFFKGLSGVIRVGFMALKGLERRWIDMIVEERVKRGGFSSFSNFLERVPISAEQLKILIKGGAFDPLHGRSSRFALVWKLFLNKKSEKKTLEQRELFQENRALENVNVRPNSMGLVIQHEMEVFGFPLSCHPLDLFQHEIDKIRYLVEGKDFFRWIGKRITTVGWAITSKRVVTKNNEPMEFATFEDRTSLFETVLFPETYKRFYHLFREARPYLLTGLVQDDQGTYNLHVDYIRLL